MELFRLDGKAAFVTGASSGIGQRIAIGLAEAGASVACFGRNADALSVTVERILATGGRAVAMVGDVTIEGDINNAIASLEQELGSLAIAVNSAGIAGTASAENMTREQWQRMIDVNLTGVFLSCQAEARAMMRHRSGSIVNIASMSGTIVNRGIQQSHYSASKAAVMHLTKSLAMEWVAHGIRVNAISPGYTLTPMNLRPEMDERRKEFGAETPMGRMASVDELVGPAVFLASKASSFCTGIDLIVDGGFVCW